MTMAPEILLQLTELIGWELPAEYIELLEQYPASLSTRTREPDHPDCEETVAEVELLNDPQTILAINQEARRECILEPNGDEFVWPDQMMVIGETGTGDYFCIDVSGDVDGVIQYNHQAVTFEIIAESLEEFIEILEETFNGELDDEHYDEDGEEEDLETQELSDDIDDEDNETRD